MATSELERALMKKIEDVESDQRMLVSNLCAHLCENVRQITLADNTSDGALTREHPFLDEMRTAARDIIRTYGGRCSH